MVWGRGLWASQWCPSRTLKMIIHPGHQTLRSTHALGPCGGSDGFPRTVPDNVYTSHLGVPEVRCSTQPHGAKSRDRGSGAGCVPSPPPAPRGCGILVEASPSISNPGRRAQLLIHLRGLLRSHGPPRGLHDLSTLGSAARSTCYLTLGLGIRAQTSLGASHDPQWIKARNS